jgi:hypothetical protein
MTAGAGGAQFAAELRPLSAGLNRKLRLRTASGLTPSQSSIIATLAAAGPLPLGVSLRAARPSPHLKPRRPSIGWSSSSWSNGPRTPTTHVGTRWR